MNSNGRQQSLWKGSGTSGDVSSGNMPRPVTSSKNSRRLSAPPPPAPGPGPGPLTRQCPQAALLLRPLLCNDGSIGACGCLPCPIPTNKKTGEPKKLGPKIHKFLPITIFFQNEKHSFFLPRSRYFRKLGTLIPTHTQTTHKLPAMYRHTALSSL